MRNRSWFLLTLLVALFGKVWAAGVTVVPTTSPRRHQVVPAVRNFSPQYSPDGKWIAFLHGTDPQVDAELWVMDAEGKNARALLTLETMRYALTRLDMDIHGAPAATQELERPQKTPPAPQHPFMRHYAWHPKSQSLICQVSSEHGKGGVYQVMLDGSFRQVPHPLGYLYSIPVMLSWGNFLLSPNGKEIAFVDDNGFFEAPLDNRESAEMKFKTGYTCIDASWGIDGRIYAAMLPTGREGATADIYAITPDGAFTPIIITPEIDEHSPSLSPDGKWLAFLRQHTLIAREQATGKEATMMNGVTAYRWLPTGHLLATISTIQSVDLRSDPLAPREMLEDIVVTSPGAGIPELRILYRTTAVPSITTDMPPFYRSGKTVLDLTQTRSSLGAAVFPRFLNTLPDISPDGKRMVYEWEGALYLIDLPQAQTK